MPVSFDTLIKQKTGTAPVLIREEDILTCVALKDHRVTGARVLDSWFAYHQYLFVTEGPFIKPDPVMIRSRGCPGIDSLFLLSVLS